jgi:hypothetical protein
MSDDGFDRQDGGGPAPGDMGAGGGSSGAGGYGNDQDAQDRQAQAEDAQAATEPRQSRGERFDEMAGGGRGADSVSFDKDRDGNASDRGQSAAEEEV